VAVERDIEQAVVRGSELLKQGKLDAAQQAFRAALALDNANPKVLALLGLAHFRAGQFDQARPIYEELVDRAPTDAAHRLNLGLVYLKLNDAARAIDALEASRALDPSQSRATSHLGLAYARAGRYVEAYKAFLVAGQRELATEVEGYLTAAERDGIKRQLEPQVPQASFQTITPPEGMQRIPRTKPPSAPPKKAIVAEKPAEPVATPSVDPAVRITDSMQFVMSAREPTAPAAPEPVDGQTMISRAVAAAAPAAHAAESTARVGEGSAAPASLSQLATDELVRPDDGDHALEVTASGALIVRVTERVLSRLDGVHVTGGDLAYEPATRRSRGHQTEEPFDYGGPPLHAITGHGYLIALPGDASFAAVALDDDILYVREDLVFAFQSSLRWENGNVPGLRGRTPVVQFRGDGAVALRVQKPLVRVKLPPNGVVFVDAKRIAGWIGRVIPRAVVPPQGGPMGDVCIECTGEGIVLVDPVGDPGPPAITARAAPPPPPAPPAEASLELDAPSEAEWVHEQPTKPAPAEDPHRDEF